LFEGSKSHANHGIMLGDDSGHSLREANRAQNLVVRYCKFFNRDLPDGDGTVNYHNVICKSDNAKIYENEFYWPTALPDISATNFTFVYIKGGTDCAVYNNYCETDWDEVNLLRVGATGANNTTNLTWFNNDTNGTYKWDLFANSAVDMNGLLMKGNRMGSTGWLEGTGALDLTALTSLFVNNFTGEDPNREKWGGITHAKVTGLNASPSGFIPVGPSPAGGHVDPIIGDAAPGWNTPVEAYTSVARSGLTGVQLSMYVREEWDRAALLLWLEGVDDTGTVYAVDAAGTLEIVPA
jgi:hypothetical protein